MSVPYRPLGHIREVVHQLGLEVTYIYEDLIYIEHNAFLLQMGDRGENVSLYFNRESAPEDRGRITSQLQASGQLRQLDIVRKGTYSMMQKPDEASIQIEFFEGDL